MVRALFFGAPVSRQLTTAATPEQLFELSGRNAGNTLIGQSLLDELVLSEWDFGTRHNPAALHEKFDRIVIPAANFLFRNFDFTPYADFLDKTSLPCLMVGLGAQAPAGDSSTIELPKGTLRFISIVAERSKTIGVRGNYTAEVMSTLGFKNVRVVGCPSLYRTLHRELGIRRRDLAERPLRVSLNGSRNVTEHSYAPGRAADVERQLIELALQQGYDYVLQNEHPEIRIVLAETEPSEASVKELNRIAGQLKLDLSGAEFYDLVKQKFRVFFDIAQWDEHIRQHDFALGSRFHGNIIALTNGVPAVIFPHDSRTTEMCQLMHVPHVPVDKVGRVDVDLLYELADFDGFSRQYTLLFDRYAEFLTENGCPHRLDAPKPTSLDGEVPLAAPMRTYIDTVEQRVAALGA